jgi:hypothetical protein
MGAPDLLTALWNSGIRLSLDGGSIRAEPKTALTDETRALIRAHKAELIELLRARDDPLPDPAMEARRQRVLAMLAQNPRIKRAIITDTEADPDNVIVTIGIRDGATCDLAIPKTRYDAFLLLKVIEAQYQEAT